MSSVLQCLQCSSVFSVPVSPDADRSRPLQSLLFFLKEDCLADLQTSATSAVLLEEDSTSQDAHGAGLCAVDTRGLTPSRYS